MAEIHRTPQDVYALILPQSPLDEEFEQGDDVIVPDENRVERLQEHGWIEEATEQGSQFRATLTHTGAAIINYWRSRQDQGDIVERLEQGVGVFVDEALDATVNVNDVDEWEIEEMSDGTLVVAGETPQGVRIERTYHLHHQTEHHPVPA